MLVSKQCKTKYIEFARTLKKTNAVYVSPSVLDINLDF